MNDGATVVNLAYFYLNLHVRSAHGCTLSFKITFSAIKIHLPVDQCQGCFGDQFPLENCKRDNHFPKSTEVHNIQRLKMFNIKIQG